MKRIMLIALIIASLLVTVVPVSALSPNSTIGINVVLKTDITDEILNQLSAYGRVRDQLVQIDALTMSIKAGQLAAIRKLPFVASASTDKVRNGAPIDTVEDTDFTGGGSTWDLDAINVTEKGSTARQVDYDGTGVYVAVLDTGLVDMWRRFFPEERIAEEYGIAFGGGGGEVGSVSSQPNKWEHDQDSHGTHVTSTIIGFRYLESGKYRTVNGVAPNATIIPVKVLNQNGSGWSSVVARGIAYIGDLKANALKDSPVVINMSLGGPELDAMEKAAIDYAISQGVIIVASAGNSGKAGMGYPGAYPPVISVAASGWVGEWISTEDKGFDKPPRTWWFDEDVADPTAPADFYIADFSSRALAGQDLDVAAPGSWVRGPYLVNSGRISYYYLGGTSMASPHVAGIAALMAQKKPTLAQADVESILEESAIELAPGSRDIMSPYGPETVTWEADATGAGLATADAALAMVS